MNFSGLNSAAAYQLARQQGIGVPATQPAGTEPATDAAGSFQDQIKQAQDQQRKVKKIAGDLVSNALILPVLKQIRRSPFAQKDIFRGGIGENTFGPEFDMQMADRIAHSPKMTVTDALARRLSQHGPARSRVPQDAPQGQVGVDVHG